MSWLNLTGNISSFTSNITNFTREVLTEAGSEAEERFAEEDADSQLHSAQYKIKELETKIAQMKVEVERVHRVNDELQERAESAELQVQAVSSQYRSIIQEKESELHRLRDLQYNGDLHQHTYHHGESLTLTDEDELFVLNSKLEKLSKDNKDLQEQCETWKRAASKHVDDKTLDKEALRESQQQEVAALQNSHNQRISSLKKKHKEEVRSLKEQILKLSGSGAPSDTKARSAELENALVKHHATEEDLLNAKSELQSKDRQILTLQADLSRAREAVDKEKDNLAKVQKHNQNLQVHIASLTEEAESLKIEIENKDADYDMELKELQSQISTKSDLISKLQSERGSASVQATDEWGNASFNSWDTDRGDLDRLQEEVSHLKNANQALSAELHMNEIVLSSIERLIRGFSDEYKDFHIADFESWFNDMHAYVRKVDDGNVGSVRDSKLHCKQINGGNGSLEETAESSVSSFSNVPSSSNYVSEEFSCWIARIQTLFKLLECEATTGKDIMANCTDKIPSQIDFSIKDFSEWLVGLREKLIAQDLRIDSLIVDNEGLIGSNRNLIAEKEKLQCDINSSSTGKMNEGNDRGSNEHELDSWSPQPAQVLSMDVQQHSDQISKERSQLMTEIAMLKSDIAQKDNLLASIETGIRDFDDEDVSFTIREFPSWIQKVQDKMDSLAEDLLFEQETRSEEDRMREEERKKLNHIFMQKQQEIAELKVELYKVSASQSHVEAPAGDQQYDHGCEDNESYMSVQEKLIEAITRCEALSVELAIVAAEKDGLRAELEKIKAQQRRNSERSEKNLEMPMFVIYADLITECVREILNDGNPVDLVNNLHRLGELGLEQKNLQVLGLLSTIQALGKKYLSRLALSPYEKHPTRLEKHDALDLGLHHGVDNSKSLRELTVERNRPPEHWLHERNEANKSSDELENNVTGHSVGRAHDANADPVCRTCGYRLQDGAPASNGGDELSKRVEVMQVLCDSIQSMFGALQEEYPEMALVCDIKTCCANFHTCTGQDFKECVHSFESLFRKASSRNSEYRADAEKWKRLYDEVLSLHGSQQTKIQSLGDDLSDLQTQRIVLQDCVDTLRQELESVTQNYQHLQCENEVLQAELDKLQFQMDTNETDDSKEISELKMQLDELKQEREDLIKVLSDRDDSIQEHQAKLASVTEQHTIDLKIVEEQLELTRLLLAERETANRQLEDETAKLKRTLDLLNDDIERLRTTSPVKNPCAGFNVSGKGYDADVLRSEPGSMSFSRPIGLDGIHQRMVEEELVDELDMAEVEALNSASLEVSVEEQDVSQLADNNVHPLSMQVEQLQLLLAEKSSVCKHLEERIRKLTERNPDLLDMDLLQEESYQLKQALLERERELSRLRASLLESQNASSDMILVQQECRQLKQLMNGAAQELHRVQNILLEKEAECQTLKTRLLEAQNENSDLTLVREESRQLKVMLMEKDKELKHSRFNAGSGSASALEDLLLLQDECRRTKSLLLEKDEQCRALQVELTDMRNQNSDMELLHEECRQLKSMLMNQEHMGRAARESGTSSSSQVVFDENKRVKEALNQRDQELNLLKRKLVDVENRCSDVELLHEECRQLKLMLAERDRQLLGTDALEIHNRYSALVTQYNTLVQHYQQLQDMFAQKERDVQELQVALSESDSQEENIHLLQTEYRAVEEKLSLREKELAELRDKLFAAETLCERAHTYKEQFAQLKQVLGDKETELANLKLQSSESSILESESVSLLQQEMNQLRGMLYDREKELIDIQAVLTKKTSELQQLQQVLEASVKDCEHLRSSTIERDLHEQLLGELQTQKSVIAELNSSLAVAKKDFDRCSQELRDKDTALNKLRVVLARSEAAQEELQQKFRGFREESDAVIRDFRDKVKEYERVNESLSHVQQDARDSSEKLRLANVKIVELENAKVGLERTVSRLHEDITKKDGDLAVLSGRLNAIDVEVKRQLEVITRQVDEIEALSRTVSDLEQSRQELLDRSMALEIQCAAQSSLSDEMETLKSTVLQRNSEVRQLNVSLQNKDEELGHARKLLSSRELELKSNLEKLEKMEKLQQEAPDELVSASLKSAGDSEGFRSRDMISDLTALLGSKTGECERLEEEVVNMRMQNNELIGELAKLESAVRTLEAAAEAKSEQLEAEKLLKQDLEVKLKEQQRKSKKALLAKEKALASANNEIGEFSQKMKAQEDHVRALSDKLERLSYDASEKDEKIRQLNLSVDTAKDLLELRSSEVLSCSAELTSLKEASKNQLNKMEEDIAQLRSSFDEKIRECETKEYVISDLRSQLTEWQDLQTLYGEKCSECEDVRKELAVLQESLKRGHAVEVEADSLRAMVEKNSKLYLEKTKDCDRYKLEIIQLETKVYDLQSELEKRASSKSQPDAASVEVKRLEKDLTQMSAVAKSHEAELSIVKSSLEQVTRKLADMKMTVAEKNSRIDELQDSLSRFQSLSKSEHGSAFATRSEADESSEVAKDRVIALGSVPLLDVPGSSRDQSDVHSPAHDIILRLQKEKTELFEESHRNELKIRELERAKQVLEARVKELEVIAKHQEVKCKEIEVKTARDLERLRSHMMKMEEGYTKDVLEAKEREKSLESELESVKNLLSQKSHNFQSTSDEFRSTMSDMQEQVKALTLQKEHLSAELSKRKQLADHNATAMKNLQLALEQLQREKEEQCEYLTETSRRQLEEARARIEELRAKENQTQNRIQEAHLAVQGVAKLSTDIQQKDEEVKSYKDKVASLITLVQEREQQLRKVMEAAEHRLDRALMKNLLTGYFHAPESKRADIVHVIGGLLGLSNEEVEKIGTGSAPNSGGWVSSVFSFGSTPAKQPPDTPAKKAFRNEILKTANQSFSELFVSFLQHETENGSMVPTASLAPTDIPNLPPLPFLQPSNGTLSFSPQPFSPVKSSSSLLAAPRIPAPGQEIPRVHTHQAHSTLKTLLAT